MTQVPPFATRSFGIEYREAAWQATCRHLRDVWAGYFDQIAA
jgi:hypothetical protein